MRLVAVSGGQTLSFPLRQGSMILGRHVSCHICIPAPAISRRHCQIYVDGAAVSVRDLGSAHGTFVNGQRVERADLHDGDVLSLGHFQLRFELAEGAAGAGGGYARAAGPAEDVIVVGGPASAPPPAAAPQGAPGGPTPYSQGPPPPAPTDFPESPTGEETPVDQSFIPAPYVPHQETVLGPASQPQLVVREGRWFLRDPRTGREVEIAPTGAAGAAAARPAEVRRPNTRLLVTAVAIAAVVVVLFSVVILRPKPPVNTGPRVSDAEYARDLDTAVDALAKGDYAAATTQFQLATDKRKDLEPARLLGQYAMLLQSAKDEEGKFDFRNLNRIEAKRYLESVLNTRCPSEKAIAYAREKLDWIDKESVALGLYEEAIGRLKRGSDSEEVMLEVRGSLLQIPPERFAAKLAKATVAEITRTVAANRLARAEREKAQLKWADAIAQFQEALPYVEDKAGKDRIAKQTEDCRRYATEAELIKQAQEQVGKKEYPGARETLKGIKPGYYYDNAQRLLTDIKDAEMRSAREAIRQQIVALYASGAGPQAADLAEKNAFPEFQYITERIKRIEKLLDEGKKAEDKRDYKPAEDAFTQAVAVEADDKNDYHRRAQAMLDALKARYPDISVELADGGYRKLGANPVQARKDLDAALQYDPKNERAQKLLGTLDRQARLAYSEGRGHMMANPPRPAHAQPAFERARDCAAPGSNIHQLAIQELEKLKE